MIQVEKDKPLRQLQRECKQLSDRLMWSGQLKKEVIYIYKMKFNEWTALLLTRYNKQAVEIIQTLPTIDRFFYQTKVNRFKQLSIWCIRRECEQKILSQLYSCSDLRLEVLDGSEERRC